MVLTMENHSLQLVVLEESLEIGSLEPVQFVPADSDDNPHRGVRNFK